MKTTESRRVEYTDATDPRRPFEVQSYHWEEQFMDIWVIISVTQWQFSILVCSTTDMGKKYMT